MNFISTIDLVMGEHRNKTERANRIGWLVEDGARSDKGTARWAATGGRLWLLLVVLLVALVAALAVLGAPEMVSAGPITVPSGPVAWQR
jgi:hypothetical protein